MSASTDLLELLRTIVANGDVPALFGPSAMELLHSHQNFEEARSRVANFSQDPDKIVLFALRALAEQRAQLSQKYCESELVVTFPATAAASARHTPQVIREMFERATDEILIAGYAISESGGLPDLIGGAVRRGIRVTVLCSDWQSPSGASNSEVMGELIRNGGGLAVHEYRGKSESGIMHVKCLVVDQREMLVGSANFTNAGMHRNYELGVWMDGPTVGVAYTALTSFLQSGMFVQIS